MADPPARSPTTNFYSILGISKSASLADIGKAYRSLVMKWHPDRNTSNRAEAEARFTTINEAYRVLSTRKREEADASNHGDHKSTENSYHHRRKDTGANDELIISSPTLLSCTSNRITPTGTPRTFSDGSSHGGSIGIPTPKELQSYLRSSSGRETPPSPTSPDEPPVSLSRATSKRTPTPIIFSRTTARRKAQPIEKKLECTLEELNQDVESFDRGRCRARKGTSTTVPTTLPPTITVSPLDAPLLLI